MCFPADKFVTDAPVRPLSHIILYGAEPPETFIFALPSFLFISDTLCFDKISTDIDSGSLICTAVTNSSPSASVTVTEYCTPPTESALLTERYGTFHW